MFVRSRGPVRRMTPDQVCVGPQTQDQTDNTTALSSRVDDSFGPHTRVGFFGWRQAAVSADVGVSLAARTYAAQDNAEAWGYVEPVDESPCSNISGLENHTFGVKLVHGIFCNHNIIQIATNTTTTPFGQPQLGSAGTSIPPNQTSSQCRRGSATAAPGTHMPNLEHAPVTPYSPEWVNFPVCV